MFSIGNFFQKFIKPNHIQIILVLILAFSLFSKIWRLSYPDVYVFDEVYAGFTAEQYAQGNIEAWVYDFKSPEGFAYNWDHPPLGRLIMSVPIRLLGVNSFSRRLIPMLAGVLLSLVVFKIGQTLFPKKPFIWLASAFLVSLDGLVFSLSRIALCDTLLTLFITTSIYFLLKKKYLFSAIFLGSAVSVKWTGVFLTSYIGLILLMQQTWKKDSKIIFQNLLKVAKIMLVYLGVSVTIYLASYIPLFINFGFEKFIQVQQQAYWYHSRLQATHPAQSLAWSWPLMIKPVWFWVKYEKDMVANIYSMGNPLIFWNGLLAIFFTLILAIKSKQKRLFYLLLAYPACWLQWIFSPRIMFLYHYLPAVPILCITLSLVLNTLMNFEKKLKPFVFLFLSAVLATFIFFYPYWSGMPVAKSSVEKFHWLSTWKH
jgi:dolichyl-phosphate-mannose-protein mannosyltransferase